MAEASDPYELIEQPPDPATYLRLRAEAGLSAYTEEAAGHGLAGTWYGVSLGASGQVVGMGRIIGDGGCFFQIVDIAVTPAHQGRGLGRRILAALMARLEAHAPRSAYVSLIADVPADRLYRAFGFTETAPRSIGMARRIG